MLTSRATSLYVSLRRYIMVREKLVTDSSTQVVPLHAVSGAATRSLVPLRAVSGAATRIHSLLLVMLS
jgi:hypothetical protein